jgi:hypothetical protein
LTPQHGNGIFFEIFNNQDKINKEMNKQKKPPLLLPAGKPSWPKFVFYTLRTPELCCCKNQPAVLKNQHESDSLSARGSACILSVRLLDLLVHSKKMFNMS